MNAFAENQFLPPAKIQLWESAYSAAFIDRLIPVARGRNTAFPVQLIMDSGRREINYRSLSSKHTGSPE